MTKAKDDNREPDSEKHELSIDELNAVNGGAKSAITGAHRQRDRLFAITGRNPLRTPDGRRSCGASPVRTVSPLVRPIGAMQNVLTRRQIIATLSAWAVLYGCILFVNWLQPKACSTAFWPPEIHCRWDF